MNLVEDAHEIFLSVPVDNGVEVWRLVNENHVQKTSAEKFALRENVVAAAQVPTIGAMPQA